MSYIEKEKLIKADIASIENRVRHAFNQGYDLGFKDGKERAKPQEPKTGHCKDCKWWKDSNGTYRRGCGAESPCPINTLPVYQGEGYCYLFLSKAESEGKS